MEKAIGKILLTVLFGFVFAAPPPAAAAEETISLENAVFRTLRSSPGVKIQQASVEQKTGLLQTATGKFDWTAYANLSRQDADTPLTIANRAGLIDPLTGLGPLAIHTEQTVYNLGLIKPFRSGIRIIPSIATVDYKDDISQLLAANQVQTGVEVVVPLLRGLGVDDAGAEELAAKSNLLATEQLSKYNISKYVYTTSAAFWECLAAKEGVALSENAISRVRRILGILELLVQGGIAPPDQLSQAQAKIKLRQSDLREALLGLYKARQALALAMGYSPQELPAAPLPEGSFPDVIPPERIESASPHTFISESLNRREDYRAGRTGINTEQILSRRAEKQTRPRLDFDLKMGYAALDESSDIKRYLSAFSGTAQGPNVYAGLVLELPIQNNIAKGEAARRRAIVKETELSVDSLANTIGSDVLTALESLKSHAIQYGYANQSRITYEKAVQFETTKLQQGEGSLTTLIQMEDDHLSARMAELSAMSNFAQDLVRLRFVSGTLLHEENKTLHFRSSSLMSLPFMD
ncbi:MAG: TolC family protein [Desulfobacteraceae bacterium]|nr:TolC family protein [Desulfobacteraceae bacterium]